MVRNGITRLSGGLALLLLGSTSALAAEADAFAARLQSVFAEQGTPLEFSAATAEGEDVILSGVRVGAGEESFELETVRFETVTGSNAEGWRVERVPFEDIEHVQEGGRTLVSGIMFEGLTIAPEGAEDAMTDLQAERAGLETMIVEREGGEAFRLSGLAINNQPGPQGGFSADFTVREFMFDSTISPDSEGARTMAEIGYPQVRGDISGNALWNTETGELSLSPLAINVQDTGVLSFAYTITGYTPAFMQSLAQLQSQMAANPDGQNATGMAMIGLISQLYLNSAELTFDDASLTNKILDYYAERNGQSRDALIDQLLQTLPLALGYLQNPQFQAEVTQAVENFLRAPDNIVVAIEPPAPVPATQVIGAAMGAPQTLPAVLSLTVRSND
ncbi:hypothetical protein [Aureimonas populi]|uniref:DUF945 domain-containing protein n=1 Tax=Aureimonas populi TaxID=1701758 RepID=A0ABW5CFK9_9HYPH|nr:hypothetical protein [Aureimonas populi]